MLLGVDIEDDESKDSVLSQTNLFLKGIGFNKCLLGLIEEKETHTMFRGEVTTEGFWFKYQPPVPPPVWPTLADWDDLTSPQDLEPTKYSKNIDKLLWWLSAKGHGQWVDFTTAFKALDLEERGLIPAVVMRHLILLGHLENSVVKNRWTITPTTYLCTTQNEPFLTGARTVNLEQESLSLGAKSMRQPNAMGPSRYAIPASTNPTDLNPGSALQIANVLPDITEWMLSLPRYHRPSLQGGENLQRFSGVEWTHSNDLFETDLGYQGPSGLYRLLAQENERPLWTAFYHQTHEIWLRADLSALKFIAIFMDNPSTLQAVLKPDTGDLRIPFSQRWPLLYEKVLVLASGWLPTIINSYLYYPQVGQNLAQTLCNKLHITLKETQDV